MRELMIFHIYLNTEFINFRSKQVKMLMIFFIIYPNNTFETHLKKNKRRKPHKKIENNVKKLHFSFTFIFNDVFFYENTSNSHNALY